ncbi:YhgE/Pip domain-containing protein [Microbacterium hominis]|uniref:ABC transporter permease n=1 Tax=Microbacterium hominis TaxID=162426 RepID=A0A7D4PKS2_9MICO|nr:YhgE/Pip domain-containing protein [Microbacterium hominis]QKJ18530.1 ABC transporter permease [Microbacterium hominis]
MTLPIERARSRRPITWLTLIGVILLPAVIGGILVAALYNPTERLDSLNAAVVNEDEAVTIDGQLVPLGRQLTAGLVEGSDDLDSNLTWTISNPDDAEEGLADGTYAAVITIPENFSAAATSTQPGATPEQAVIEVTTPPDSLIVDDAITAQVASAASTAMGDQLSSLYLENVLLGFTTLGDELGGAADGAAQLADGAGDAAEGTVTLADGIAQLSSGAGQLADGANGISSGVGQLAGGAHELASGATGLADGANGISSGAAGIASGTAQLASGTTAAADGLDRWAAGANDIAAGGRDLANGLDQMAVGVAQLPDVPPELVTAANDLAANSAQISTAVTDAAAQLAALSADCLAQGGTAELCDAVAQVSADVNGAVPTVTGFLDSSGALAAGVEQLAAFEPTLVAALQQSAAGASGLADGMAELATGATDSANGLDSLAAGMTSVSGGAAELGDGTSTWAAGAATWSSGASTWASGASQAATGASTWSSGASAWASGASDAAGGAGELAGGIGLIADGTDELAGGLQTAVDQIPSYTEDEAADVAAVVADPVSAEGVGSSLFGASAIPLLSTLALWFGGLGSFIALQAVSRRTLSSRASSAALALRALLPAAGLGALQGLLVAGVVQLAAEYTWGEWFVFAALCVAAGVAFAAVNQALVAVFGGAGRWASAMVGVLTVATGIVSTVPGVLASLAALLPTAPAYNGMVAALTTAGGVGAALAGLVIWTLLALVTTILAVARRRSVSARQLLASPAPALA